MSENVIQVEQVSNGWIITCTTANGYDLKSVCKTWHEVVALLELNFDIPASAPAEDGRLTDD